MSAAKVPRQSQTAALWAQFRLDLNDTCIMKLFKRLFSSSIGLPIACFINIASAILTVWTFAPLPINSEIETLSWGACEVLIALVSAILGVIFLGVDMAFRRRWLAFWAFLLFLAPMPTAMLIFRLFLKLKGFHELDD